MSVFGVDGFQGYQILCAVSKEGAYKIEIKTALKTGFLRFVKVLNREQKTGRLLAGDVGVSRVLQCRQ
jgi:hypothetical protein